VKSEAVLASITRGRQWDLYTPQAWYGYGMFFAPNPDFDPIISYYVRDAVPGQTEIKITDALADSCARCVVRRRADSITCVGTCVWNPRCRLIRPPVAVVDVVQVDAAVAARAEPAPQPVKRWTV